MDAPEHVNDALAGSPLPSSQEQLHPLSVACAQLVQSFAKQYTAYAAEQSSGAPSAREGYVAPLADQRRTLRDLELVAMHCGDVFAHADNDMLLVFPYRQLSMHIIVVDLLRDRVIFYPSAYGTATADISTVEVVVGFAYGDAGKPAQRCLVFNGATRATVVRERPAKALRANQLYVELLMMPPASNTAEQVRELTRARSGSYFQAWFGSAPRFGVSMRLYVIDRTHQVLQRHLYMADMLPPVRIYEPSLLESELYRSVVVTYRVRFSSPDSPEYAIVSTPESSGATTGWAQFVTQARCVVRRPDDRFVAVPLEISTGVAGQGAFSLFMFEDGSTTARPAGTWHEDTPLVVRAEDEHVSCVRCPAELANVEFEHTDSAQFSYPENPYALNQHLYAHPRFSAVALSPDYFFPARLYLRFRQMNPAPEAYAAADALVVEGFHGNVLLRQGVDTLIVNLLFELAEADGAAMRRCFPLTLIFALDIDSRSDHGRIRGVRLPTRTDEVVLSASSSDAAFVAFARARVAALLQRPESQK